MTSCYRYSLTGIQNIRGLQIGVRDRVWVRLSNFNPVTFPEPSLLPVADLYKKKEYRYEIDVKLFPSQRPLIFSYGLGNGERWKVSARSLGRIATKACGGHWEGKRPFLSFPLFPYFFFFVFFLFAFPPEGASAEERGHEMIINQGQVVLKQISTN